MHINATRANSLISLRPFNSIDDLVKISEIADARLKDIKEQGLVYVD